MKNTILFFFLLLAAAVSAQSNSFVTDRLRAAEYLRIGTNTSQKVTGFDRVITAPAAHDSIPTSRAVVDFLQANFTPIGYYTSGDGISISDDVITNAAPDQVVGLTGGGISVITGTYPNFTITSNEVDGSTTNELQNLSLSGQSLSISSGTGVTLPVVGVSAGTGIGVSGSSGTFTVTNTGDLSTTNEIQTLSLSGSDLSLSLGGGTVTLPGGADGNGIYSGDGTIPGAVATLAEDVIFSINYFNGNPGLRVNDEENRLELYSENNLSAFVFTNALASMYSPTAVLSLDATGNTFSDLAGTPIGLQYAAEYTDILTNDRSIPDVGLTKQLISSENGALGTGFTNGGGAGTIPYETSATLEPDGFFRINWPSGNKAIYISDNEQQLEFYSPSNTTSFFANDGGIGFQVGGCYITMDGTDSAISSPGTTSIPNALISPVSYTNAAAPNNTIFYSTTDSKLSYKDPAGVVHNLY